MADNPSDDLTKIQDRADKLVSDHSALHSDYGSIETMYFMDEEGAQRPTTSSHDPNDVQVTISPSARNDVIGIVRVMTASEAQFEASSKKDDTHKEEIEELCRIVLRQSGLLSRGRITTDAVRATSLFADTHLVLSRLDDVIGRKGLEPGEKKRLEEIRKRTPMLVEVVSPTIGYPSFGRFGMRVYLIRKKMRGEAIKEEWPLPAGMTLDDNTDYEFNDWYDLVNRAVWLSEFKNLPLLAPAAHNMPELPIAVTLADGSSLWNQPERMRQPFLYAKNKGSWWKRENLLYTQMFTALWERGSGILLGFDEKPDEIELDFAGPGVRFITAPKPRLLSDTALDPSLLTIKNQVLDAIDAESTVYKQLLGSNAGAGQMPFSSLSLLSQSGQVALSPIQDSVQNAIKQILLVMLRWIKREGVNLDGIVDMKPDQIPDDIDLAVTLEVNLPQDTFRNAQIAETLEKNGDVSREWTQTKLLQIPDSKKMRKAIWTEQATDAFYAELLKQALSQASVVQAAPAQKPPANTEGVGGTGGTGGVNAPAGPGAEAAAAGGETLPATQPMQPGANPEGGSYA